MFLLKHLLRRRSAPPMGRRPSIGHCLPPPPPPTGNPGSATENGTSQTQTPLKWVLNYRMYPTLEQQHISAVIFNNSDCNTHLGDPGVGKTNVLMRYSRRQFDYSYRPTQKVAISKSHWHCIFHTVC